jgi:hypothetical protein
VETSNTPPWAGQRDALQPRSMVRERRGMAQAAGFVNPFITIQL